MTKTSFQDASERQKLLPSKTQQSPAAAVAASASADPIVKDYDSCPVARFSKMRILLCLSGIIALVAALSGFVAIGVIGYPLHASCRVEWTFGRPCNDVKNALTNQMEVWKTADTCGTGQKCLYTYKGSNDTYLWGIHTTPVKKYVDDISYTFTSKPDNTCYVLGLSSSQLWYAILDYGTNYCNIKNLVDGANLQVNDTKFSESTRDGVCTQYSSSNCEVY